MGCNNTKLNSSEGEGLPAKIRPLLRQRIEEFRKRRNVRGGGEEEGDLSKKELLKGDDHDDDGGNYRTHSSYENEVVKETETQPPKEQAVVRVVVPVEKLSKVVPFPLPVSECETEEQPKKEKDVEKKPEIPIIPMAQQESKQEGNPKHDDDHDDEDDDDEDDDDEDDEDEDDESEFGRYIGPGSPSFRIYCIEAEKRKEKEIRDANARYIDKNICHEEKEKVKEKEQEREKEKEEEKETIPLHNKSPSSDSDGSATSASASGNEVRAIAEFKI